MKRAYYIDVSLDDDIESSVQGVIRDIKSKEITSGTFKNITSVLNSVGAYEDYYIPTVDGERPLEIDTVPGLDVDIDNDFMQYLRRSIITGMNCPATYIDATTEVDFARSLTMMNNPFVRAIINDQEEASEFFSNVVRALYKNEFSNKEKKRRRKKSDNVLVDNFDVEKIFLRFPSPIYLLLGNLNDQINNAQGTMEFITGLYFPEDPSGQSNDLAHERRKTNFKKRLAKESFLQTMDWDKFDKIYSQVWLDNTENIIKDQIAFNNDSEKSDDNEFDDEDEF